MKRLAILLLLALPWRSGFGLDAIVLEADSGEARGDLKLNGLAARLGFPDTDRSELDLRVAAISGAGYGPLRTLHIQCTAAIVREPLFACSRAAISAQDTPLGALAFDATAAYHSNTRQISATIGNLPFAGGHLQLAGDWNPRAWRLHADGSTLALEQITATLRPWWLMPAGWTAAGHAVLSADASGAATTLQQARVTLQLRDIDAGNEASTYASDKLGAALEATAMRTGSVLHADLKLRGNAGQLLAGPVFLDFNAYPMSVQATGSWSADVLELDQISVAAPQLLTAHGQARINVDPGGGPATADIGVAHADISIESLQFPAAYTSFLQQTLAATDFGALKTTGLASGRLLWQSGRPQQLDLELHNAAFDDPERKLRLDGVTAALHWRASADAELETSHLRWQRVSAYGVEGGLSEFEFDLSGDDFSLTRPARLSLFDGGLAIARFEIQDLAGEARQLDFDATLEPVSMPLLSRALGWPEMSGKISGRVPGLEYRDRVLRVAGEMTAQVFDGTVSLSRLQLSDPLGKWPRLSADFSARRLDLEQFTRTFPIGSITGRLDADIRGLELFNWSPTAFDAHLYTSPGDRSRHRISQKAVSSLSDIGGGGGVTAALQSGFLKFFDSFGYDRIDLRCQLRNDVCLMDGIRKPGGGFYIVKGGGLPRLDIVANSGRVAWGQLLSQVESAMKSGDVIVK